MRMVLLRYVCQRAYADDQRRALDCHHQFVATFPGIPSALEVPATAYLAQGLLTRLWYKAVANVNEVQRVVLLPLAKKSMELHRLAVDVFARAPEPFQEAGSEQTVYRHLMQLAQEGMLTVDDAWTAAQELRVSSLAATYTTACEALSKAESDDVLLLLLSRLPKTLAQKLQQEGVVDLMT